MANPQFTIQSRAKLWGAVAIAVLLALWLGVPTFNKWRADRLVDELCAKDGGIKVYETVTLPKGWFNQRGQFAVPNKNYMKQDDEFYYEVESQDIIGNSNSTDIGKLSLYKSYYKIFRKYDGKLLGQTIMYARRGGDPIGPWHPSSYSCHQTRSLEQSIFQKADPR